MLPIEKDLVWLLRDREWEEARKLLRDGVSPHVLDREVCMQSATSVCIIHDRRFGRMRLWKGHDEYSVCALGA